MRYGEVLGCPCRSAKDSWVDPGVTMPLAVADSAGLRRSLASSRLRAAAAVPDGALPSDTPGCQVLLGPCSDAGTARALRRQVFPL